MKDITMFYLTDCGYCAKAHKAMDELMEAHPEYKALKITKIEEDEQPEIANQYDYFATPTFYVGKDKIFEAHVGMSYDQIKDEVANVLKTAYAG